MKLKRAGSEFEGRRPFHEEKTPSFSVNPAKGVYHCHGCGSGGSVTETIELHLTQGTPGAMNSREVVKGTE